MDIRIATPEEHAAWKLELKTLFEQNGVSQDLTSRCLRLFGQALEVNPNKPVGWSQILDVLLSFKEVVAEEGYGTAWNNQSGEIECFEGATKIDIALAYMNKIHNQRSKPFARKAEDLLFEANVQEEVFEKACEIMARIQYNYYFDETASLTTPAPKRDQKEQVLPAYADVNDWFLTLEPGRQKVLREDKWMLAGAAYKAGLAARPAPAVLPPAEGSKLRCIARLATGALVFEEGREYEVKRLQDGIIEIYNDSVGSYATLALDKLGAHFEVTHYAPVALERVASWRERLQAANPRSEPDYWPTSLKIEYMQAEIDELRAILGQDSEQ